MDKEALISAAKKLVGHFTGSNVSVLKGEAKRRARELGRLKSKASKKVPWYKSKKRHKAKYDKKIQVAKKKLDTDQESLRDAVRKHRLARGGAVAGGLAAAPMLLKKKKEPQTAETWDYGKYGSLKLAFKPISATKSVMKSFGTAPKPAAGMVMKTPATLPRTNPSASTFKVKRPTPSKPIMPKPPMPKPPNVTTGGLLRPGKNVVS